MDSKKIIGRRINAALAEKNLKQKDLAEYLGVKDNTISYFCSGSRLPNTLQIIKISEYLGVSTDYLLGLDDNKTTDTELKAVCKYTGLSTEAAKMLNIIIGSNSDAVINQFDELELDEYNLIQRALKFDKDIPSLILSNDTFWSITLKLKCLRYATKQYSDEWLSKYMHIPAKDLSKEDIEEFSDMENADIWRYSILRQMEKISDKFDGRVQKEAPENGKHNTKKE